MKWFTPIPKTLEELKKMYRTLAMKHHPDVKGGSTTDMQQINNEYDELFAKLKDTHATVDGKTYTETTNETPEQFRNIIDKLITLDGVVIEIVGCWIWLTGKTYQHKEIIKSLHFQFSKSKKAWYYHNDNYTKRSKKTFTLDQLKDLYGSQTITDKPHIKLAIV